jgi:hypothetical protein
MSGVAQSPATISMARHTGSGNCILVIHIYTLAPNPTLGKLGKERGTDDQHEVLHMSSGIMRKLPLLLGIAVGAALVAGLGMEINGGNVGLGMVLGVGGITVIEFSVALSAANGNILLFFPSFKKSYSVSNVKTYKNAKQASNTEKADAHMNAAAGRIDSGAQLSLASHPALGQVDLGAGSISLKTTVGGIYIDSMDSVKQSVQGSLKEVKTDKQEKVNVVKTEKPEKKKVEKKLAKTTVVAKKAKAKPQNSRRDAKEKSTHLFFYNSPLECPVQRVGVDCTPFPSVTIPS